MLPALGNHVAEGAVAKALIWKRASLDRPTCVGNSRELCAGMYKECARR